MKAVTAPILLLLSLVLLGLAGGLNLVEGAKVDQWKSRRIYQILTDRFAQNTYSKNAGCNVNQYCGGTFNGTVAWLDYITGMGFNAIWISPVVVNYHQGYHGYWATNFFEINPHFGSKADLKAFVAAAHAKDVWIMVDVVVNHVGPVGNDFSQVQPFNESSYYHKECQVSQYICETEEVLVCRLADLPDLNQTVPFVKQKLQEYVQWLLTEFSFDGIRADTVMYIENDYWVGLQKAVGTYIAGEVWSTFDCNLKYTSDGIDATLNYPLFDTINSVYLNPSQSMWELGHRWRQLLTLKDPDAEVNFVDNHDNNRFLNYSSSSVTLLKSALTHIYFTNGIPCVLYGTEQQYSGGISDNYCREPLWWSGYDTTTDMYRFLTALNSAHKHFSVWQHQVMERWRDETIYCFIRGVLLICTTNQQNGQTRTIPNLQFQGMKVCNWLHPKEACVEGASTMTVSIPSSGEPLILYGTS